MTEQTGENFQASPELGFAFGRIPMGAALDFLTSPELRTDREADDLQLYLSMIDQYFKEGPSLYIWHSYVDAVKGAAGAKQNDTLPELIHQKYREIVDLIYQEHISFMNDEASDINALLIKYPGIVARDVNGEVKLQSIELQHLALTDQQARMGTSPIQTIAHWSNETQTEPKSTENLYVDMTALPMKYSRALNQYRTLYEVDVTRDHPL